MDKFVKLSAIEKMAQSMPSSASKDMQEEGPDMAEHGCKCECCGNPCDICAEEDTQHEDSEDSSMEDSGE